MFHEDIPTVNISKLNYSLLICIAKNFIWTKLKMIFSIFAHSDSRFSTAAAAGLSKEGKLIFGQHHKNCPFIYT